MAAHGAEGWVGRLVEGGSWELGVGGCGTWGCGIACRGRCRQQGNEWVQRTWQSASDPMASLFLVACNVLPPHLPQVRCRTGSMHLLPTARPCTPASCPTTPTCTRLWTWASPAAAQHSRRQLRPPRAPRRAPAPRPFAWPWQPRSDAAVGCGTGALLAGAAAAGLLCLLGQLL